MSYTQLGTWTTIDCPTQKIEQALEYLRVEFDKIEGIVRKVLNPHDFGSYPSFEIDLPEYLEYVDSDCYDENASEADLALIEAKEHFIEEANAIEEAYGVKFEEYL